MSDAGTNSVCCLVCSFVCVVLFVVLLSNATDDRISNLFFSLCERSRILRARRCRPPRCQRLALCAFHLYVCCDCVRLLVPRGLANGYLMLFIIRSCGVEPTKVNEIARRVLLVLKN